jgi:hypothetical protein
MAIPETPVHQAILRRRRVTPPLGLLVAIPRYSVTEYSTVPVTQPDNR